MIAIADNSDIALWDWKTWAFVLSLALVAVVVYAITTNPVPTPRDAAPVADEPELPPVRAREVPPALRVHLCAECGLRPVDRPGMVCAPYCVHPSHEAEQIIRDAGGAA